MKSYTDTQKQEARSIDIVNFLSSFEGFNFKPDGRGYRCVQHDSLVIYPDKKGFFWNSQGIGGSNTIDWLIKIRGKNFTQAMSILVGEPAADYISVQQSKSFNNDKNNGFTNYQPPPLQTQNYSQLQNSQYSPLQTQNYSQPQNSQYSPLQTQNYSQPQNSQYSPPQPQNYSQPQSPQYSPPQAQNYTNAPIETPIEKRYNISKNLDKETDFIIAVINDIKKDFAKSGDTEVLMRLDNKEKQLLTLQNNLQKNSDNVFTVNSRDYKLAVKCRDLCSKITKEKLYPDIQRVLIYEEMVAFSLPDKAENNKRAFAYLSKTRNIDNEILSSIEKKGLLYQDTYGNAVFVGKNNKNNPAYAFKRSTSTTTSWKTEHPDSLKDFGFCINGTDTTKVYVFESPIDVLSHASMVNIYKNDPKAWEEQTRLSLGGISDLSLAEYCRQNSNLKEIILCLDNDTAGKNATSKIITKYSNLGYQARAIVPQNKDFNDDLKAIKEQNFQKAKETNTTKDPKTHKSIALSQ